MRIAGLAALLALIGLSFGPSHEPLSLRQARLVIRSYADVEHLGQFRIIACRRISRSRLTCRVEEGNGYIPLEPDHYRMGVKRRGCSFLIRDCGTGQSCTWQRWL